MARRSIMEAQRARNQANRENRDFDSLAGNFETAMRDLDFKVCSSCIRKLNKKNVVDQICNICRNRRRSNPFTAENGFDFGVIPQELQGLTMVEQILISKVYPVVSVYKIRGAQTGYSGHVMNFVQNVSQMNIILPLHRRSINSIFLLNRRTPSGIIQFKVRAARVRRALVWLEQNNIYYRDIVIDENVLNDLPHDGDVSHHLPRLDDNNDEANDGEAHSNIIDRSCFPNIQAIDAAERIQANLRRVQMQGDIGHGNWPDLGENRMNEFESEGIICQAFPCLFPYGRGDLREPRLQTV